MCSYRKSLTWSTLFTLDRIIWIPHEIGKVHLFLTGNRHTILTHIYIKHSRHALQQMSAEKLCILNRLVIYDFFPVPVWWLNVHNSTYSWMGDLWMTVHNFCRLRHTAISYWATGDCHIHTFNVEETLKVFLTNSTLKSNYMYSQI